MSTTNENRIAPDQRANITTPELLALYSRLEAVTAQRDQCKSLLYAFVAQHDGDMCWCGAEKHEGEHCPGRPGEPLGTAVYPYATTCLARDARAALRACDEKRSEASIAAEGGAL